jgi:heme oxygenase (biliverdin-IX-beta and delta-forming)
MGKMAEQARTVLRDAGQAALATALARDGSGWPYASLVLACVDRDHSPILLLSDLADHVKNLKRDPRASLLFEDAGTRRGGADALALPRVTLLGQVRALEEGAERERLKSRFLARHPSARDYAGFGDFRLYRMSVESAHLVAGFGQVQWLSAGEILGRAPD